MDCPGQSEDSRNEDVFFTAEISGSSDGETDFESNHRTSRRHARTERGVSPPLILAFSATGRNLTEKERRDDNDDDEGEDSDQPIEEWMILGGEEQRGDSSIQINLGYWSSSSSSVSDPGDEDENYIWALSKKDKEGPDKPNITRYYDLHRTGRPTKSIHERLPVCVLCGIPGHTLRDCPSRHCPCCTRPAHCPSPCQLPPLWNQHCQRCGVTGHLSDACPDTWRQYHLTIHVEVPVRPKQDQTLKRVNRAQCYNCAQRGHYGHECARGRMLSGMFPSVPYVCSYDTMKDILQRDRMQKGKDIPGTGVTCLSAHQQFSAPAAENVEDDSAHERKKRSQEAHSQASKRKRWPEKRRERRELKRLRREVQAKRESGKLGESHDCSDDEMHPLATCRLSVQSSQPPKLPLSERGRHEANGRRSRKSREAERWRKRRGMKRGDIYPHSELDISDISLLSPKQRVRHSRR